MYSPQTTEGYHEIRPILCAYFHYQTQSKSRVCVCVCGDFEDKTFDRKIITHLWLHGVQRTPKNERCKYKKFKRELHETRWLSHGRDDPGFNSRHEQAIFLSSKTHRPAHTQPAPYSIDTGGRKVAGMRGFTTHFQIVPRWRMTVGISLLCLSPSWRKHVTFIFPLLTEISFRICIVCVCVCVCKLLPHSDLRGGVFLGETSRSIKRVPRRDEVTGEWRRLHNEELND